MMGISIAMSEEHGTELGKNFDDVSMDDKHFFGW